MQSVKQPSRVGTSLCPRGRRKAFGQAPERGYFRVGTKNVPTLRKFLAITYIAQQTIEFFLDYVVAFTSA